MHECKYTFIHLTWYKTSIHQYVADFLELVVPRLLQNIEIIVQF